MIAEGYKPWSPEDAEPEIRVMEEPTEAHLKPSKKKHVRAGPSKEKEMEPRAGKKRLPLMVNVFSWIRAC
ncbi:hypothetical protein SUGI_1008720 [Cryptomeria japonica]|nr:hypothetical protein SUGI_1008720 [Cryptomeria japonica]